MEADKIDSGLPGQTPRSCVPKTDLEETNQSATVTEAIAESRATVSQAREKAKTHIKDDRFGTIMPDIPVHSSANNDWEATVKTVAGSSTDQSPKEDPSAKECGEQPRSQQNDITVEEPRRSLRHETFTRYSRRRGGRGGGNRRRGSAARLSMIEEMEEREELGT